MLEEMQKIEKKPKNERKAQTDNQQQFAILKTQYESLLTDYSTLAARTDGVVQNGLSVMTMISQFAERAKIKVIEIVDELFLPQNIRKNEFKNIEFSQSSVDGSECKVPSKIYFKEDNLSISLAIPEVVEKVQLLELGFDTRVVEENSVGGGHEAQRAPARVLGPRDLERLHFGSRQAAGVQADGGAHLHDRVQR